MPDLAKRAARAGGHAGDGAAPDRVPAWRGPMTVGLHFTSGSVEVSGRVAGLSGTAGAGKTSDLVPALVREDSKTASEDGGPQPVDPDAAPLDAFGLTVVRDGSTAALHARLTVR